MKIKVKRFTVLEGPLYEVNGEDGPINVFNSDVVAVTDDGRMFTRSEYLVFGAYQSEDGFFVPNLNYKNQCLTLIQQLSAAVQEIDTDTWEDFTPVGPDLEARLAYEASRENQERLGLPVDPPIPVPATEARYMLEQQQPALRTDDVRALALEERLMMGGGLSDADRNFLSHYNE